MKTNRFRIPVLVDVFIEDEESLDEQKRQATIKGQEIKTLLESKGFNVQLQETFYNPFANQK